MLTFITWLKKHFSGFSTVQLLFPATPASILNSSGSSPHLINKELCFTSLKVIYIPNIYKTSAELLGILLHKIFFSSPFIYLINYLFISVWTDTYLFCILAYNPICLFFFFCSYCSSFGHCGLFQWHLCCQPLWDFFFFSFLPSPTLCLFVCLVLVFLLPYFVELQDPDSSCIFPTLVLESAISSGNPASFHWRILKIKIWY